jgi:hypothetical protein
MVCHLTAPHQYVTRDSACVVGWFKMAHCIAQSLKTEWNVVIIMMFSTRVIETNEGCKSAQ